MYTVVYGICSATPGQPTVSQRGARKPSPLSSDIYVLSKTTMVIVESIPEAGTRNDAYQTCMQQREHPQNIQWLYSIHAWCVHGGSSQL